MGGAGQLPGARVRAARALLRGGGASLAVIAVIVLAQRLVLPLAVLRLDDRDPKAAAAALLAAAALGFVRARAADRLARAVRLNVIELYLGPFERGPVASLPASEVLTARLANALPLLVSWAVDGIAVVIAASLAAPLVAALLAYALGVRVLAPLAIAGVVGAIVTALAAPRVEASWTLAWDRSRAFYTAIAAGFEGAVDLRAHGRAGAFASRLREDVRAWSIAEGRARVYSTLSTWGAFGATLSAGALVVALSNGALAPEGDLYRTSLLVLTAIPTLQTLVGGLANMVAARDEIANVARQISVASASSEPEVDAPIDVTAEIALDEIGYAYPGEGGVETRALDGLSLTIAPRKSLAIVGPNGAGKTTLLHVLLGVARPDRGSIRVGGAPARLDNRRLRERVAYLSQRPYEIAEGTIGDNLRAIDPEESEARLVEVLERVGLLATLRARAASDAGVLGLPYAALSRGQSRRVMLARALLRDADLLVLDEPEAHLDAASVAELAAILSSIARERRVIAAVHDRAVAAFADEIIDLGQKEGA